jgi:hypothetical protein
MALMTSLLITERAGLSVDRTRIAAVLYLGRCDSDHDGEACRSGHSARQVPAIGCLLRTRL